VDELDKFVIPLSVIGHPENISSETVRRVAKRLESDGQIAVQRTPYGRGSVNIPGYRRLLQELLSLSSKAA